MNLGKCWYLKLISWLGSFQVGSQPYLTMAGQKLIGTADRSVTKLSCKWPPLPKTLDLLCSPEELTPSAETQHRGGDSTESSRYWQSSSGNQGAWGGHVLSLKWEHLHNSEPSAAAISPLLSRPLIKEEHLETAYFGFQMPQVRLQAPFLYQADKTRHLYMSQNVASYQVCSGATSNPPGENQRVHQRGMENYQSLPRTCTFPSSPLHFFPLWDFFPGSPLDSWAAQKVISMDATVLEEG